MGSDTRGGTEVNTGMRMRTLTSVPKLVATAGPGAGRALAMADALATVGRHPINDLVLVDPQVSGVHLELETRRRARPRAGRWQHEWHMDRPPPGDGRGAGDGG